MNSKNMTLTTEWVQISDGSVAVDLQPKGGGIALIAIGDAAPESAADAFICNEAVKIAPPLVGWARTGNSNGMPVDVTVTQ